MRTRNADNPKSPPAKKTPPAKKSAAPATESTSAGKRGRGKAAVTATTTPEPIVDAPKVEDETVKVTPGTKSGAKRTVKRVVKRTVIRKKAKSGDSKTASASVKAEEDDSEVPVEKDSVEHVEEMKDAEPEKQEELSPNDENDDVGVSQEDDKDVAEGEDKVKDSEDGGDIQSSVENVVGNSTQESSDVVKSVELQEPEVDEKDNMETEEEPVEDEEADMEKEEVDEKENKVTNDEEVVKVQETNIEKAEVNENENKVSSDEEPFEIEEPSMEAGKDEPDVEKQDSTMEEEKKVEKNADEDKVELENEPVDMEKDHNEELKAEDDRQERLCFSDEEKDKDMDEDELTDEKREEHGDLGFEEEHEEMTAAAEERRRRKEFEIFVGGLDRDATEEEVKKAFQYVGEVVEVRMHKELPTNKNKGYAFVRFATKEHVARALAEMKNPVIHGKRCGTSPSEDNDTLFLGNICNTWTKEAVRQKLKDYGIEGVERITLVADPQHEGLSRGFAFIEFSGHPDAQLAYKRLQKPDAIFGHSDRTAKVAFAEPLREPDPEVLAQVKSVFVDGLPPHWDEDIVREHLKSYGTIDRVMLARNMSSAKRKDFGFIDFTTHEAAVTCIDGINSRELGDGKMKVRARLSNPLPKTQAVKGGIAGGFRIGQGSGATFPRAGRGFGRGATPSNRTNFQRGRGSYQHGHAQTSRMGFAEDYPPAGPRPPFRGRQNFGPAGGRWNHFRGSHQPSGRGTMPPRYDADRPRHGVMMNHDPPMPMRGQPFPREEEFIRPYSGRHYEDPYAYGDASRGVKRLYYADPDYSESSRGRPRLDYSGPANSAPGTRYQAGGSGAPSRDYYNYDYSSYYGSNQPYGGNQSYGGVRPYGGDRPYGGERPFGGERPSVGERPYGGDRPYGGNQPTGSDRPYAGRYY